jgi:hypothetical protein
MKIRVIQPHINESGPVKVGTILDLHEDHAADFIAARLAVPHADEPSVPAVAKPVEQATAPRRKNKETR